MRFPSGVAFPALGNGARFPLEIGIAPVRATHSRMHLPQSKSARTRCKQSHAASSSRRNRPRACSRIAGETGINTAPAHGISLAQSERNSVR
jgi:hypothetical protein